MHAWLNFQHLEQVIKSRIPGLQSLINKTILELESELSRLGKPVATDQGVGIKFISAPISSDIYKFLVHDLILHLVEVD